MSLSAHEVDTLKHAPAVEGVLPAIHHRWSPRSFTDRAVEPADLVRVFEAARWAPSSNNEQPWRYIVGLRGSEAHSRIASSLAGYNTAWAPKAPVLILGMARARLARHDSPNIYAMHDLGAASVLLAVQATALGLAAHQMGGFDHDAIRKALSVPEEYLLGAVIALGYLGEPAALGDETLIVREQAPRTRKPLSEMVYTAWGEPAQWVGRT